ncbi:aspartate/glutamate racemase family protein, partial [bacterium]|nr:aspartate/glutamate racemase family protein [bacterium]
MATISDPRERPIAVFDSGVGGLTVLHELLVHLPEEDYIYLGDTARFPYGERTPDELASFSLEIAEELLARNAKLLVVACNSATSAALPVLAQRMRQTTLGVEVLGVVRPEAIQAVATTNNGRIGLLATNATVASGAYDEAVHA